MEQRETIRELAHYLKTANVDKDTAVNISLRVRKFGQAERMIAWLKQNKTATVEEICAKSREIHREGNMRKDVEL